MPKYKVTVSAVHRKYVEYTVEVDAENKDKAIADAIDDNPAAYQHSRQVGEEFDYEWQDSRAVEIK